MKICKDGRIYGQNNKEAGVHLGILKPPRINKGFNPNSNGRPFTKGYIPWNKGLNIFCGGNRGGSKKGIKRPKISGKNHWNWKGGISKTKEYVTTIRRKKGEVEYRSLEHRKKISESLKKEKNPKWKGGISSLRMMIRNLHENKQWLKSIFIRDNYTCQECFKKGIKLEIHHIKSFSLIFQEFLQQYNQFSPIDDKETLLRLAINYKPFWNIDNGITYCKEYHRALSYSVIN